MKANESASLDFALGIDLKHAGDGLEDYGLMMLEYDNGKETKARGGLPNVLHKLTSGGPVTVGYLGGSITRQQGWRPRTTAWLGSRFPKASIAEVNAAISGTGGAYGAARIEQHLLPRKPDLVFVEFVVNGATVRDVEGIVRKIWRNNPYTDICFVYTLRSDQVPDYAPDSAPVYPSSLQAFETVADHYGIPGIFLGYVLGELYASGKLVPKAEEFIDSEGRVAFTKDGIHPVGTGDQLYAGAVARSMIKLQEDGSGPRAHSLKPPIDAGNWEEATMIDAAAFACGLEVLDTRSPEFGSKFPYTGTYMATIQTLYPTLVKMTKPGDRMTVRFKGTVLGIADVGGPFSGRLSVVIDSKESIMIDRFTMYNSYLRHQHLFLPEMEDGEHTVTFTLVPEGSDKRCIVQNKADFDHNPGAYKSNEVYIGHILAVGQFLA